jgi:GAF domain-containing protein
MTTNAHAGSTDLRTALEAHARREFPFPVELSLRPLLAYWEGLVSHNGTFSQLGRELLDRVRRAPELAGPIADAAVVERHRDLVRHLMSAVFSPASSEQEYAAALVPFQFRVIHSSARFQRTLLGPDGLMQGRVDVEPAAALRVLVYEAYALILARVYGAELPAEYPLVFSVTDREDGLDRYFTLDFDSRFIEVKVSGEPPALPDALRARMCCEPVELDELTRALPPDRFTISGFAVVRALDVTEHVSLSGLRRDLIHQESIVSSERFGALEDALRVILRRPDLLLKVAAIDGDRVLALSHSSRMEHACIFADSEHHRASFFAGSIFERAATLRRTLIVPDLETAPSRTAIEDAVRALGVRSLMVAPLLDQGRLVGTLALESPTPNAFTAAHLPKLDEVLPLFAMAVTRSVDQLNTRVQAFIKEKCTAIHPVVEWRFRQAVLDALERHGAEGGSVALEPIVFKDVYPLYALADIRGSSTQRAWSIQADLLTQLGLARDVLAAAHDARRLPILHQLTHRLDRHLSEVEVALRTDGESAIIAFLRREIEPLFEHVESFGAGVRERVEAYRRALDPTLGTVYARRRAFEESLTAVADEMSAYLDLEAQAAQAMFPHYFEKQKTDGVDYTIYVGGSLVEDGRFDPLYMRNLRLWQLMVSCGIAARIERLKERLPLPLDVTNLILVQHAPLAIRFREDEKRFDVDGAYNARYAIIKSRVDKAVVRGGTERLTQPGKIAIVYSQSAEAAEYRDYIEYLQSLSYLTREVEELELDELQGARGLRALRVTVDLAAVEADRPATQAVAGRA